LLLILEIAFLIFYNPKIKNKSEKSEKKVGNLGWELRLKKLISLVQVLQEKNSTILCYYVMVGLFLALLTFFFCRFFREVLNTSNASGRFLQPFPTIIFARLPTSAL
jgi:hypothetical protein